MLNCTLVQCSFVPTYVAMATYNAIKSCYYSQNYMYDVFQVHTMVVQLNMEIIHSLKLVDYLHVLLDKPCCTVVPTKGDSDVILYSQLLSKTRMRTLHLC